MESRERPRYSIFDVHDLWVSGVPVKDIRRRVGRNLDLMVLACLGGLRTEA